jgi:hypothetical protein
MSATDIINELPKLNDAERRAVLNKLLELARQAENIHMRAPSGEPGYLAEAAPPYRVVDLQESGINEAQAADLRARLKGFAEDWERPEASIYDEDPAR